MLGHLQLWQRRNPMVARLTIVLALLLLVGFTSATWAAMYFQNLAADRQQALQEKNEALRLKNHTLTEKERLVKQLAEEKRTASEQVFLSNLAKANGFRWSGQLGQRVESLAGLKKAADLIDELGKGPDDVLKLRNAAINSMALYDLVPIRTWERDYPKAFDQHYKRYARVDSEGQIIVRRVRDDEALVKLAGAGPIPGHGGIFFSPNGRYLAAYYCTFSTIWDLEEKRRLHRVSTFYGYASRRPFPLAFSPDSSQFVALSPKGEIRVYDIGQVKPRLAIATGTPLRKVQFAPDGKRIIVNRGDSDNMNEV